MTPEDFDALFENFRSTAYRLETLPFYDVGSIGQEAERFAAFRENRPIPERSVRTDPWMQRIARTAVAGKAWKRVRVVDEPLSEFERYELISLVEAQAVGDENFIVLRREVGPVPDMWLFDADMPERHAVLMDYDPQGKWRGCRLVTDGHEMIPLVNAWNRALTLAEPLAYFLAETGFEGARTGRA